MKFRDLMEELLIEASKLDILINKIGLNEKNANVVNELCGPLSVWMTNKLIDHFIEIMYNDVANFGVEKPVIPTKTDVLEKFNRLNVFTQRIWNERIVSIMDWIRVGLNGNLGENKNLDWQSLMNSAETWHKSLGIGEGQINYVEENDIIIDYRENGIGYYWVNLNTNNCGEEAERMGHCANTSRSNTLYSLRNNVQINPKYTLNKSFLTAAVGRTDGIIYQLKGGANSKPDAKFHPYILDLLIKDTNIKGFGGEYDSANDFKISDLGEEDIKKLYQLRPELFNGRKEKKLLISLGLMDKSQLVSKFKIEISPSDVDRWVDGDWVVSRRTTKEGRKIETTFFEHIINGETWELYDRSGYDGDWKSALQYHVDKEDELQIWEMVKAIAVRDGVDIEGLDLEDSIEECDADEIKSALSSAMSDSESDGYQNKLDDTMRECLSFYGTIEKMDDTGVIIDCDFDSVTSDVDESYVDDALDRCNEDLGCALRELISDYIDKPKFSIDDRWTPDVDNKTFKENLNQRLSEI
jgi:hypothetical protein